MLDDRVAEGTAFQQRRAVHQAFGYADLHAMRKNLSTMMAAASMSQRTRQAHMRYIDSRLTENTYVDETLLPMANELVKLPPIPNVDEPAPDNVRFSATGTDDSETVISSANIQQMSDVKERFASSIITNSNQDRHDRNDVEKGNERHKSLQNEKVVAKRKDMSSSDNKRSKKRVSGLVTPSGSLYQCL